MFVTFKTELACFECLKLNDKTNKLYEMEDKKDDTDELDSVTEDFGDELREDLEEYVRRNRQRAKYKPLIDHYNLYN